MTASNGKVLTRISSHEHVDATSLPSGSPPDAVVRLAWEVPDGVWLAQVKMASDPKAWRLALRRMTTPEYVVFYYTLASPGRASEYAKFPRDVWLAWCSTRPTFPSPAPAASTVGA